jgi:hypothetical protein
LCHTLWCSKKALACSVVTDAGSLQQ